jgi:hypothetical protein
VSLPGLVNVEVAVAKAIRAKCFVGVRGSFFVVFISVTPPSSGIRVLRNNLATTFEE